MTRRVRSCVLDESGPTNTKRSQVQERRTAKTLSGRTRPGSGCFSGMKGDVQTRSFLIQAKTTQAQSFTLKQDELLKAVLEALGENKDTAFAITFERMPKGFPADWVCVPLSVFKERLEKT